MKNMADIHMSMPLLVFLEKKRGGKKEGR